jgi:hypothetical protein
MLLFGVGLTYLPGVSFLEAAFTCLGFALFTFGTWKQVNGLRASTSAAPVTLGQTAQKMAGWVLLIPGLAFGVCFLAFLAFQNTVGCIISAGALMLLFGVPAGLLLKRP